MTVRTPVAEPHLRPWRRDLVVALAGLLAACPGNAAEQTRGSEREPESPPTAVSESDTPGDEVAGDEPESVPQASPATDFVLPSPDGPCEIRIVETLSANVYRGVRPSPARTARHDRHTTEQRESFRRRSHGLTYLSCDYRIEIDGIEYRHTYNSGSRTSPRYESAECDTDATAEAAIENLRQASRDCSDFGRAERLGVRLDPIGSSD